MPHLIFKKSSLVNMNFSRQIMISWFTTIFFILILICLMYLNLLSVKLSIDYKTFIERWQHLIFTYFEDSELLINSNIMLYLKPFYNSGFLNSILDISSKPETFRFLFKETLVSNWWQILEMLVFYRNRESFTLF